MPPPPDAFILSNLFSWAASACSYSSLTTSSASWTNSGSLLFTCCIFCASRSRVDSFACRMFVYSRPTRISSIIYLILTGKLSSLLTTISSFAFDFYWCLRLRNSLLSSKLSSTCALIFSSKSAMRSPSVLTPFFFSVASSRFAVTSLSFAFAHSYRLTFTCVLIRDVKESIIFCFLSIRSWSRRIRPSWSHSYSVYCCCGSR